MLIATKVIFQIFTFRSRDSSHRGFTVLRQAGRSPQDNGLPARVLRGQRSSDDGGQRTIRG